MTSVEIRLDQSVTGAGHRQNAPPGGAFGHLMQSVSAIQAGCSFVMKNVGENS